VERTTTTGENEIMDLGMLAATTVLKLPGEDIGHRCCNIFLDKYIFQCMGNHQKQRKEFTLVHLSMI